ncbi:hypothetical protein JX265_005304 [Neoarthrinium moseri]|uniref:Pyroglutamyl peptidase type I n=1 Tax=Neoarthrinium moseri TaxID=1658444 RepID=A0A9P9WNG7_9PEZI|nr:hypothetical protein JX265_005304 [Neoarthrinium moseri]
MGSIDTIKNVKDDQELTVLVTGFGPFKDGYPVNPSWEIASALPEYLPWDRVKDPAHKSSSKMPRVRLLVHPQPIRVNYKTVRELVPTLWDDPGRTIDLALHIGMAGPPVKYAIERRAHRDGYKFRDVDGHLLEGEGGEGVWPGAPEELLTELDVEDIYERWVQRCPDKGEDGPELKISEDPGRYLCDFIYFSSLEHLWRQHRPRKVLFLHVPAIGNPAFVKMGTELATQLIRAIVESEVEKKAPGDEAAA